MVISFRVFSKNYLPTPISTKIASCVLFCFFLEVLRFQELTLYRRHILHKIVLSKKQGGICWIALRSVALCHASHISVSPFLHSSGLDMAKAKLHEGGSRSGASAILHWGFRWGEVMRGRYGSADGIQPPCPALSVPVFLSERVCLGPAATPAPPLLRTRGSNGHEEPASFGTLQCWPLPWSPCGTFTCPVSDSPPGLSLFHGTRAA